MSYSALDPEASRPVVDVAIVRKEPLEDRVAQLEANMRTLFDWLCGPEGDPNRILNLVKSAGDVFGVPWRQINSQVRTAKVAEARHAVQWIAHYRCCVPNAVVARMFMRHEQTVGQSLATAQDRIEVDPGYRRKVEEVMRRCGINASCL